MVSMTTPDPRHSMPRSSFAIAMRDYTFIDDAAALAQWGVQLAAVLLALTVLAAGMLVVPMAWLYLRHKRGATIEVKV